MQHFYILQFPHFFLHFLASIVTVCYLLRALVFIQFLSVCPDRLRGSGTAATNMCLVATGAVEAFFEIGIHCWDIAAGAVIVKEAGGILLDVDGVYAQSNQVIMQNRLVVKPLLIKALFDHLGGPFDLMSRRMLSANNQIIADRIMKEIEPFPVVRDDAPMQKKSS